MAVKIQVGVQWRWRQQVLQNVAIQPYHHSVTTQNTLN